MSNYVQLKNILGSGVATIIAAICFIALIFFMGFCLGRIIRLKKLEDKWDKQLTKSEKAINEILKEAGVSKEIILKRED